MNSRSAVANIAATTRFPRRGNRTRADGMQRSKVNLSVLQLLEHPALKATGEKNRIIFPEILELLRGDLTLQQLSWGGSAA